MVNRQLTLHSTHTPTIHGSGDTGGGEEESGNQVDNLLEGRNQEDNLLEDSNQEDSPLKDRNQQDKLLTDGNQEGILLEDRNQVDYLLEDGYLRTPGGTSLAVLQPVPAGEGEGVVTETTPLTPVTRPSDLLDMETDTDWTPDDEEDYAKVNGENINIRYKCDKPGCPPYRLDFSEIDTKVCRGCKKIILKKIPGSNMFFLNINMIYMNMSDTKLVIT